MSYSAGGGEPEPEPETGVQGRLQDMVRVLGSEVDGEIPEVQDYRDTHQDHHDNTQEVSSDRLIQHS